MRTLIATAARTLAAMTIVGAISFLNVSGNVQLSGASVRCHPLTNSGRCYEPGEFCRHSDAGVRGIAGDGKRIVCRNNDGLRWEPY